MRSSPDGVADGGPDAHGWLPIESAPKDRTTVLLCLKKPLPDRFFDRERWEGVMFVGRHIGVQPDGFDIGWQFAAPVGCGGFTDDVIAGWQPSPKPPVS